MKVVAHAVRLGQSISSCYCDRSYFIHYLGGIRTLFGKGLSQELEMASVLIFNFKIWKQSVARGNGTIQNALSFGKTSVPDLEIADNITDTYNKYYGSMEECPGSRHPAAERGMRFKESEGHMRILFTVTTSS